MFNFFKKKEPGTKVIDRVVIDETAKLNAMLQLWNGDKNIVFVFWFDDSLRTAENFFSSHATEPVTLLSAREAGSPQFIGRTIVFGEHYPMPGKEHELFKNMGLEKAIVFSSLREPLFQKFGGDRIIKTMLQFGMREDQVIEHAVISKSIHDAQEKIEKKITFEQSARSQKDWLEKNIPD